jgi:predicted RNase H-like HicB family nuclease
MWRDRQEFMKSHRYAVVVEKGRGGYGAYVPDLPVCVAVAKTEAGVRRRIQEAIAFHIRGLRKDGDPVPRPKSSIGYVEVHLAS